MKKEYNLKDTVWIHIGERTLTQGRVVEIIDLEHLGEGHSKDDELYVIELKTGIEDVYEVRSAGLISPDAAGPVSLFRNKEKQNETIKGNRFMRKIGVNIPATGNPLTELAEEISDELDEPTPEQIHAAMQRAQESTLFPPLADASPKRNARPKRKPYNRRKKSAPNT